MIAQKLSLLKDADLIAAMKGGQCVKIGTHEEMMNSNGLYSEILKCEELVKLPERLPSKNDDGNDSKRNSLERRSNSDHRTLDLTLTYNALSVVLGCLGASIFGSFRPILAYVVGLIVTAYYKPDASHFDVDKWCLIIGSMLQSEVGWFDKDENNSDKLLSRLANDATYVRAAFSNHLSVAVQDFCAAFVAIIIGFSLEWRLASVALVTIPFLALSAITQDTWNYAVITSNEVKVLRSSCIFAILAFIPYLIGRANFYIELTFQRICFSGFSRRIEDLHKKASVVLEDVVRNISIVMSYCAGNETSRLYELYLERVYKQSFVHGIIVGFVFGFSRFLLFACNAVLLWYTSVAIRNGYIDLPTALREYIVFTFATFALVQPFRLAPTIHKRRKDLVDGFSIIDHVPEINFDESNALKPVSAYGTIEFKNVDFCYPTCPEIMVLRDFTVKVDGGHTVGVVGVSGSGKSTILSLILRFYDPVSGQILLDGKDLKQFNLRWLRSQLGFVQQEPVLFSTTIRENILYARHNASETEIKEDSQE
ncbi:ABC transporter B family member 20-like protein [Tanacetum coccineum]